MTPTAPRVYLDHDVETLALTASLGDPQALSALYEKYADPVLGYIRVKVHDLASAEDVASNTWEAVARSIRRYEVRGGGFPAWLFAIARNSLRMHARTTLRRREFLPGEILADAVPDTGLGPHEQVEARMAGHQLAAALAGLPARQRTCVTLRFIAGLSLTETGQVMGLKPNAVKQLQHRGIHRMASVVNPQLVSRIGSAATSSTYAADDVHRTI